MKGTRFVDLVDEGDPPELAERYAREGADELVFLDISAAPEGRGTLLDIVERTARRAFVPLTVGGGVRERGRHARRAPGRGGQGRPQHARRRGSGAGDRGARPGSGRRRWSSRSTPGGSTARRHVSRPGFEVVVKGGREPAGLDAVAWAERAVELGAGELLVTSIDRDGTKSGFDTELLRGDHRAASAVPVIASGGAAGPGDFVAAVRDGGADAVLAAGDLPPARGLDRRGQGRHGRGAGSRSGPSDRARRCRA